MHDRKRLLIVIDSMEVAGSQRQVLHLLKGLDRQQWEPELAYFRVESFLSDAVRALGVPVHYVAKRHRLDVGFFSSYGKLLRDRDYALVHAFSLTAELWTLVAAFMFGVRPVLVASERSSNRSDRPAWYWWLKRFVVKRASAVIANSHAGATSTADRIGAHASLFCTISNAVEFPVALDAAGRLAVRRAFVARDDVPLALFVGRVERLKNLPCLIRGLAELSKTERPTLLVVGEGSLRSALARLAEELGVASNVLWLGPRRDVSELMQAADFLVLPSHYEGLSNVLLEAMASGCPVIASSVAGNQELVSNDATGLLFPDDDEKALARAMQTMRDPALRLRLASAAKAMVGDRYSIDALATSTSAVYHRCLSGRSRDSCPVVQTETQTHGTRT